MTCPRCRLENVPTADLCDCGHAFTRAGAGQRVPLSDACWSCGTQNPPDANECRSCQIPLSWRRVAADISMVADAAVSANRSIWSGGWMLLKVALVVLAIVVLADIASR